MKTWHLHIKGQVQGVGFRPHVYRKAIDFGLKGWVSNGMDGVHIEFNATEQHAHQFATAICEEAPKLSYIQSWNLQLAKLHSYEQFSIEHSLDHGKPNLLVTPDFALCETCRNELHQETERRSGYAFNTCTLCGPRYSITRRLPYDRHQTTMHPFQMCNQCQEEYYDPINRRYFAQTNTCNQCAIPLELYDASGQLISNEPKQAISTVVELWQNGSIVAIKGIGGFLITCDGTNPDAINTLRKRKKRPAKPFAIMVPNESIFNALGAREHKALFSPTAPIVLMDKYQLPSLSKHIAPGLSEIGVMVPYTPLYEILLGRFNQIIVATSGNISGDPIVFEDDRAIQKLSSVADYVLTNPREILIPQDDSVIRHTPWYREKIIIRRSRGLAPTVVMNSMPRLAENSLATGAQLKSTFGLTHQENIYISQYLGDLSNYETFRAYQTTVDHLQNLFQVPFQQILCDLHPTYESTLFAREMAEKLEIPCFAYQHHQAHFAAVLGEHHLMDTQNPVLGVIWDGTGYGEDQQIWGGEFFIYKDYQFDRIHHLEYFTMLSGDKMAKEPRLSALAVTHGMEQISDLLFGKFSATEWRIYQSMLTQSSGLMTSSMGRLFDAVASILDLCDVQSYEGQAAMLLEVKARQYFTQSVENLEDLRLHLSSYIKRVDFKHPISILTIVRGIRRDLQDGQSSEYIAARFHFTLADIIKQVAIHNQIEQIAMSGGVFQNALLVDLVKWHLGSFELFFNQQLSPNDENIPFGQLMCYEIAEKRNNLNKHKLSNYVFSDSR